MTGSPYAENRVPVPADDADFSVVLPSVLEAPFEAFRQLGGVPEEILYDRMNARPFSRQNSFDRELYLHRSGFLDDFAA
jgi:hypothetical protein